MSKRPSNQDVVRRMKPLSPLFSSVVQHADLNVREMIAGRGIPNKREVADLHHYQIRVCLEELCQQLESDGLNWLELIEESEGGGLDILVCRFDADEHVALRWSKSPDGIVLRRREGVRLQQIHSTELLWGDFDEEISKLRLLTLMYQLGDDYGHTVAGRPAWWLSKIELVRETQLGPEPLLLIESFEQPKIERYHGMAKPVVIRTQKRREDEWGRIIKEIRKSA